MSFDSWFMLKIMLKFILFQRHNAFNERPAGTGRNSVEASES